MARRIGLLPLLVLAMGFVLGSAGLVGLSMSQDYRAAFTRAQATSCCSFDSVTPVTWAPVVLAR